MDATLHNILEHVDHTEWSSLDDFALSAGQVVPVRMAVDQPNWSLYTIDKKLNCALFVELPAQLDLSESAFVYVEQHKHSRRALKVPLGALERLASKVPPPDHLIFIFSIGRCGSTLVSNILNEVPDVWGLSEPDAYTRLVMEGYTSQRRLDYPRDQIVGLIKAITRLLFRPPHGSDANVFAVKFRSQTLFQAHLYQAAFPDASFVFLYRDAMNWAGSFCQMALKFGLPPVLTGDMRTIIWNTVTAAEDMGKLTPYVDVEQTEVALESAFAPGWACNMEEYSRHLDAGVPFMALRYNELIAEREASLKRLFIHCGLPPEAVATALTAFERDSQEGTMIARDVRVDSLDQMQLDRLGAILAKHPRFGKGDTRLRDIYSSSTRC